ncbi:MAG TPA: endo alpha-1,4 polygalactosaminidase [Micromonosporaceae bacterium]
MIRVGPPVLACALVATLLAGCAHSSGSVSPSAAPTTRPAGARPWVPKPGTTWQWQLSGEVDTSVDAQMFDVDVDDTDAATVDELHAKGAKVICYINAGALEDFRPDRGQFPPSVLGRSDGWHGERWLDIRRRDVLRPIMEGRFDVCQSKGFDGVEADLVDGYTNDTGFPLTAADQLAYNRMLADLAHQRGLSIGLKNDVDQAAQLVDTFDFAIDEQCVQYQECDKLVPFIRAGKAVFHVEYDTPNEQFCPQTRALGFSSMRKNRDLDAARWPC